MKFLVLGSGGPGFASPEEAVEVSPIVILQTFEDPNSTQEAGACRIMNKLK